MQKGIPPDPPIKNGTNSRFKDGDEEEEDVILIKSITRQSPLPRSAPRKRRRQDTAGQSEAKLYTETVQSDGTVVIEFDSDNDADRGADSDSETEITKISSVAKPSPKLPFQDPDGVSGLNDQPFVKRRKQFRTEAKAHSFGKSKKAKDEQVHQASRRGPGRRVRCETVEDEGTPDCTDNTVIHQYEIHPRSMDISESKDAEVDWQSSAYTLA
ncbi:hypothetical protein PFICI_07138 [Pestalotiopsis fici W106-1]|uniref:Uncharacterized protein n=1 Tax=Pestalotiopsis fici (strain W106-1 / CGMCC3.15140) TaxID=1229662 RepID=W3XAE2_PESFW|nr:uncharacterized protein PFICI_07138 [Pestalotiopsis fici W106-1]ETS82136.1 hypothetical protein PFICI_07138 [Pestalotiopsis fici W106-1]